MDIVFRRCQFVDNNGCGIQLNLHNLERDVDAPISITFEDCDVSWRDDYPFESPWYDGAGLDVNSGYPPGNIVFRGTTVYGSAGAGLMISNKLLSGPSVTFADVTLTDTARVNQGFPEPWMRVTPIMLMDADGGLGGLWFEDVKVVLADPGDWPTPFLSYYQIACSPGGLCPNVTGGIGGDIEVQWHGSAKQCVPRVLGAGGLSLVNGSAFGHTIMENVSIGCSKGP